ncbi:transketolase family protein [Selenomonas ruminantium]|uniref:Transketolase subunit B n=1 Tax=Selenomonas ruminantium TaxID=971 RepID=A0A1I0YFL0_SELRU|nr:transketolase C-terminal domain-containing protein [Selenomonas ruminantium]SFB12149.1 transketolase subunit B [Selenomonas ruminantium]
MINIDFRRGSFLRDIMGTYMINLGEKNENVVIVNADLMKTCRNEGFVRRFPERSFNVGIAEQNMVSFAAGLAHEGFMPYVFSMAPFISMRALEQCRTDVAYANLPVRFMATYSGVSGGISGATHWGIEDCGIMCSIPNMIVVEVCDEIQAQKLMEKTLSKAGPIYIRSSVDSVIGIYDEEYDYEIGRADMVLPGRDGMFICAGITVKYAIEAARDIKKENNKEIGVIDMHTIKPIDRKAVMMAARTGHIVVAHDHNVYGGLGTQVGQVLVEEGMGVKFANLGIQDCFEPMAHAPYLYHKFGYDTEGLKKAMLELFF